MDIRRRTTYLSRGSDGRPCHNYCSFFQSSQKKNFNVDPNSGMNQVGPMFELTACVEMKGDEDDLESMYPDSSLSFGPTICSFGLKYNDHNYAHPSGLTPPPMAPHLMDIHPSKHKFSDQKARISCARDIFGSKSLPKSQTGNEPKVSEMNEVSVAGIAQEGRVSSAAPSAQSESETNDVNTDTKNTVTTSWISKVSGICDDADSKDGMTSRFGSSLSNFEQIEMRYEPELKIFQVPDELAVSPSQLSDLDSDVSDVEYTSKLVPTPGAVYVQPSASESTWDYTNAMWSNVRCVCSHSRPKCRLIRCPRCCNCQHIQCMESYYHVSMPQLTEGYVCNVCGSDYAMDRQPLANESSDVGAPSVDTTGSANPNPVTGTLVKESSTVGEPDNNSTVIRESSVSPSSKRSSSTDGNAGAQYVEVTADRAKRLGLIPSALRSDGTPTTHGFVPGWSYDKPNHSHSKEHDSSARSGANGSGTSVNWDRLNEISRSTRRPHGDTDVNLRMPSPPRASKRKQDLTSTSYNDADVTVPESPMDKISCGSSSMLPGSCDELSSTGITPSSTPSNTPSKMSSSIPGTPASMSGATLTPGSDYSSSPGLESSPKRQRHDRINNKARRALFSDSSHGSIKRLDARINPLGAWAKDYREAESNTYTPALLERLNARLATNLERNLRIPPSCLTRSSLCRVVLFDHNDKGLEAATRLPPKEVVTEVRGNLLLMEEYEHYVDPVSEYNRYVMFYCGFAETRIVINATQYGNNARFIRRSCIPNCHLEHYVVQGKLQIVICTSVEVMPGTELTIPFDFDYRACRYPLECACARSRCPVLKWRRRLLRNKVVPHLDYNKYIDLQLKVLSKPLSQGSPNPSRSYETNLTASALVKSANSNALHSQSVRSPGMDYTKHTIQPSSPSNFVKDNTTNSLPEPSDRQLMSSDHGSSGDIPNPPQTITQPSHSDSKPNESNPTVGSTGPTLTDAKSDQDSVQEPFKCDQSSVGSSPITDENQKPPDSSPNKQGGTSAGDSEHCTNPSQEKSITKSGPAKSTKHKNHSKTQDTSNEKTAFEPIITTRRQAAAMKQVFR